MIDRILTIINGPIYMGCYRTAEFERRQFIAGQIAFGLSCFILGAMTVYAFIPKTDM